MGFAALYPSYGCGTWFVSFEAPGYPPPSSHSTKTPNTTTSITVSQPRLPRSPATTVGTRGGYSDRTFRSEEHTSELQSLMRISYAVFCLKKKKKKINNK